MEPMMMNLTSPQLQALDKFAALYDTDWFIRDMDNGTLEIGVYSFSAGLSFERYVTSAGNILRYDADTDNMENADEKPLTGVLNNGHKYNY